MSEKNITLKDVEYVAKLARIAISADEQKIYQNQLERILEYVGKLKSKDTGHVKTTAHPLEMSNVWREDLPRPSEDLAALFKNAPEMEETFYKVKKVIE